MSAESGSPSGGETPRALDTVGDLLKILANFADDCHLAESYVLRYAIRPNGEGVVSVGALTPPGGADADDRIMVILTEAEALAVQAFAQYGATRGNHADNGTGPAPGPLTPYINDMGRVSLKAANALTATLHAAPAGAPTYADLCRADAIRAALTPAAVAPARDDMAMRALAGAVEKLAAHLSYHAGLGVSEWESCADIAAERIIASLAAPPAGAPTAPDAASKGYRIAGESVTDAVGEEFGRLMAERDSLLTTREAYRAALEAAAAPPARVAAEPDREAAIDATADLLRDVDWDTHRLMCGNPPDVLFRREVHRIVVAALRAAAPAAEATTTEHPLSTNGD